MPIIGDVFISQEILNVRFSCDYSACRGVCCEVEGAGAPLLPEEAERLNAVLPALLPRLSSQSRRFLDHHPLHDVDADNIWSLACLPEGPCVFDEKHNGMNRCIIEHHRDPVSRKLLKPVSCRLFPLRVRPFGAFRILEFERWQECRHNHGVPTRLLDHARNALLDRFGSAWLAELDALFPL